MNRINRRRFVAVTSVAATSAVLVACGNSPLSEEELSPTQNPDVPGAPPTLAPITSTPGADSGADEGSGDTGGDTGGAPAAITIEASDDFKFTPAEVEVAPGQTVTVTNVGFMQHDLVSEDLGVSTEMLNGGDTQDIVIPEDAAVGDTFDFHCTVPGHAESGMVGTFTIVEAGAAAPAGEEESTDEGAASGGGGEAIAIEASDDFKFTPADVEVAPGQTVTVTNVGFMQHDLVSEDLGVSTEMLNGGDSQDIVIPEDAAVGDTFDFHCTVPGHAESGMVGTFTIVEAGAAAPAGEGEETEEATAEATAEEESTEGEGTAAAGGGGEAVTIEANDDFSFTPADVEVAPGQTVTVTNAGFMQHDLVSDDLGVGTEMLNGGDSQDIVIPEDAAVGESFKFICTVAGHEQSGMVGSFTIVEGSAAAAPAGEGEETEDATAAAEGEARPAAVEAPSDNTPMASTVIGTRFQFTPAELEMAPGGVLTWQNDTDMMMGLSAEAWDDGTIPFIRSISSGKTAEFTIPADAEVGSVVEFQSNLSEAVNQGMVGKITIVEGDGSAAASPAAEATPAAGGSGAAVEVSMLDTFAYEPAEIEVSVGDTIHFVNNGYLQHDAKVDDWGDEPITPLLNNGETHDFVVPDSAEAGQEYEFYCTVAGHQQAGMVGKITIV